MTIATTSQPPRTTAQRAQALPRRIPAPATEPPYDQELTPTPSTDGFVNGALALDLSTLVDVPEALHDPETDRHLAVVGSGLAKQRRAPKGDSFFAPQRTPRHALPNPAAWCGRFARALIEVLAGVRPAAQLLRWTNEQTYTEVLSLVRRRGSDRQPWTSRAMVRTIKIQEPRDGIAEAAIRVVLPSGRSRAVAVRLEGLDGRWRCTALQVG